MPSINNNNNLSTVSNTDENENQMVLLSAPQLASRSVSSTTSDSNRLSLSSISDLTDLDTPSPTTQTIERLSNTSSTRTHSVPQQLNTTTHVASTYTRPTLADFDNQPLLSLFADNEFESRSQRMIEIYEMTHDDSGIEEENDEDSLIPFSLLNRYAGNYVLYNMTGFNESDLHSIMQLCIEHYGKVSQKMVRPNVAIFLTIVHIRSGRSINTLANCFNLKEQTLRTGINKGFRCLAACFKPFSIDTPIPKLSSMVDEYERHELESRCPDALKTAFIIDGRHNLFGNIPGTFEDRKRYFSYKQKRTAINSQFIITLKGECVFVSPGEPASHNDITMYKANRSNITSGIRNMLVNKYGLYSDSEMFIMADGGYKSPDCPELLISPSYQTNNESHVIAGKTFNKYRLLVENYFGRMTMKFHLTRRPFQMKEEMYNDYIKAVCFLTNYSIKLTPLRNNEYRYNGVVSEDHNSVNNEANARHLEAVRRYNANRSGMNQNEH